MGRTNGMHQSVMRAAIAGVPAAPVIG